MCSRWNREQHTTHGRCRNGCMLRDDCRFFVFTGIILMETLSHAFEQQSCGMGRWTHDPRLARSVRTPLWSAISCRRLYCFVNDQSELRTMLPTSVGGDVVAGMGFSHTTRTGSNVSKWRFLDSKAGKQGFRVSEWIRASCSAEEQQRSRTFHLIWPLL